MPVRPAQGFDGSVAIARLPQDVGDLEFGGADVAAEVVVTTVRPAQRLLGLPPDAPMRSPKADAVAEANARQNGGTTAPGHWSAPTAKQPLAHARSCQRAHPQRCRISHPTPLPPAP
ncbi:hypothetical protein, partial [Streptomyces sp. NBRC 110611]|uniref:hypothetical protein n=1 Tax=Streptomyces sp. NBRC 110611 TaxID=1621259 RepID=UPI001C67A3D9